MARQPKWDWCEDTLRFTSCDPRLPQPARFQLQQVTDDEFELWSRSSTPEPTGP